MAENYNRGTYDQMVAAQGAKAGDGLRGLSQIAAMAGNELNLHQGHGELSEHYRLPLHPGRYAQRDDIRRADYLGSEYGQGGMG